MDREQIAAELQEKLSDRSAYAHLDGDACWLDGRFTQADLREIAQALGHNAAAGGNG